MATVKTEVVSVRVEPPIKLALQAAAESERRSVASMLEVMVITYCRQHGYPTEGIAPQSLTAATPGKKKQ